MNQFNNPAYQKTCPRCGATKPAEGNFYRSNRLTGDGYGGYCVTCTKLNAVEWQKAHPEKLAKAASKRWEATKYDPEKLAKQRAAVIRSNQKKRAEDPVAWNTRERERRKMHKLRDPERVRHNNAISNNRKRAIKLGLETRFFYEDWKRVLLTFEKRCAFCRALALLDLEHLTPMSRGGHNLPGNVVPACRTCNSEKGTRTLEEYAQARGFDPAPILSKALSTGPSPQP